MRRRLFGRSQDSTPSARHGSPLPSPSLRETHDRDKDSLRSTKDGHKEGKDKDNKDKEGGKEKEKEKDSLSRDSVSIGSHTRHARAKKSVDGAVKHDRLSIFGGTFAGTLGKSRKPPPRYVFYYYSLMKSLCVCV